MTKSRTTLIGILFALACLQTPMAFTQSGNSLPYFAGSTLHIPRIDVQGYGSLQLTLELNDRRRVERVV